MYKIYGVIYTLSKRVVYVGKTKRDLKRRLVEHKRDSLRPKLSLHIFMNFVGRENFEIIELEVTDCAEYAKLLENKYINKFNTLLCGFNDVKYSKGKNDTRTKSNATSIKNKLKNPMKNKEAINKMIKYHEKVILCFDCKGNFIDEFESVTKMCNELKLDRRTVYRVLKGDFKQHKGYTFKIKEEF